mmetsp:Transcript_14814/g.41280  ORF Transcript_14814/g.41280 Transcript_14814/m.41280 type:complete len:398 (+) Transcript_14814:424-1617(+)
MEYPPANALHTFEEVEQSGPPSRPLDFGTPMYHPAFEGDALVIDLERGEQSVRAVFHRTDILTATPGPNEELVAYSPIRRLEDAIYGQVWVCLILKRHHGVEANRTAATLEPGRQYIVWETTQSFAAVKMLKWARIQALRGRMLEDPVKEASAMRYIGNSSPHVLGVRDILSTDRHLHIVMPYCRGGDLFGIVSKYEDGMPEPVARYWFRQILQGLLHLQSVGICHRDLSLENILVHTDNCFIIDMGMCLLVPYSDPANPGGVTDVRGGTIRRLIKPHGVCGKRNYMSPEIKANVDAFDGFAIDLWAAGVILYIMITGFPPYEEASRTDERFDIIVSGRLVAQLREWQVPISPDAGDLLQSILREDPRDRSTLAEVMAHPWVVNGEATPPAPQQPFL